MFNSKVESDKGQLEIVYDVQWKTPGNDDDKAKIIGIVDTPDIYLDWNTFKSYLIQNSGNMSFTTDDIRISYLDSDDDLIPIDSASEFRECLKFSRTRARRGRKIMMKVSLVSNGGAKPKNYTKYAGESSSKHSGESSKYSNLFCLKKKDITPNIKKETVAAAAAAPPPPIDPNVVPQWFDEYMTKYKTKLMEEITEVVIRYGNTATTNVTKTAAAAASRSTETPATAAAAAQPPPQKEPHQYYPLQHMIEKRKKKKKMPEEDSSDCTDGLQLQWEERLELLRHMQKINKREKKFEKKLDAKLEKLETKTKKIMEKKHNLWGSKKSTTGIPLPSHEVYSQLATTTTTTTAPTAPASCDNFIANQCMDAVPADEHYFVPRVFGGELVHQVWKVVNSGQKQWTDETELRFAWGSKSLVPVTSAVKCPLLKPGETGKVNVTLQAPLFAGHFESYWHFHHQGRRFGHWLGCEVIVDPEPRPLTPEPYRIKQTTTTAATITPKSETTTTTTTATAPPNIYETDAVPSLPVDLTMKSYSDDMKIYNNIEIKPEVVIETKKPIEAQKNAEQEPEKPQMNKLETAGFHLSAFLHQQNNLTTIEDIFGANINFPMSVPMSVPAPVVLAANTNNPNEEIKQENRDVYEEIYGEVLTAVENLTMNVDNVENEKKLNDDLERQSVAAEYNSGSDSDNISILSDTISVDTDSEPSEEFVVVPMPTCLNCEQDEQEEEPLTSVTTSLSDVPPPEDAQPISVLSSPTSSDNNNNMEDLKPFPEMPELFLPPMPESCAVVEHPAQIPNDLESDANTVFIRDETGIAIPVAKVVQPCSSSSSVPAANIPTTMKHSTFGDPNFGQGPNGPRFPLMNAEPHSPPPVSHNPVGPCNFRPQHGSPAQHSVPIYSTHQAYPFDEMYQAQEMANTTAGIRPATWTNTYQNIYTEQPRACKFTYAYTNSSKENLSNSSSSGSRRTSSDTRETSPVAAAVQILPETLVTGAVNVASSAINTARSVIDMLRPRHDEPLVAQWDPITPAMEAALRQLSEMGFNNRELNIMLLKQHKNDVARVISELVQ